MAREIADHIKNDRLLVIVKPNAPKTMLLGYDEDHDAVRIAIHARPTDGRANEELLKFLKRKTGRPCRIKSGATSRKKLVEFS